MVETMKDIKLIAHGGDSQHFPENTIESILGAVPYNPYAIEMDVVLHPDRKELVCFHPDGPSSVHGTYSAEEIQKQLARSEATQLPTLEEILARLGDRQKVLLDFKQPTEETFLVARDLFGQNVHHIIFGVRQADYFLAVQEVFKELAGSLQILALFADPAQAAWVKDQGGRYFRLVEKDVTAESVKKVQDLGLEAWIVPGKKAAVGQTRTAGEADEEKLRWLFRLGIDGILVNDIALATKIKDQG